MKINETWKRTLLKGVTQRIFEITFASLVLSLFVTVDKAIGLAVVTELICYGTHIINERFWNKTDYGREIV